jgi:predicted nucleic acid-binding Zn ribbon protein
MEKNIQNIQRERKCPVCGKIILGRSDKVFCSDDCRTDFYNAKMREKYRKCGNYKTLKTIEKNCRCLAGRNATFLLKIILSITVMCKIMTTFAKQKVRQ